MKIKERMKKIGIIMGTFLITIYTKVNAMETMALYGTPPPVNPEKKHFLIWQILAIPIIVLIGIGVYLVKSKSSWKKKIMISIGIIILVAVIYGIIWFIVSSQIDKLKN